MGSTTRTTLLHYGGAVVFTTLAVVLRLLLDPWLGNVLPFSTSTGRLLFPFGSVVIDPLSSPPQPVTLPALG